MIDEFSETDLDAWPDPEDDDSEDVAALSVALVARWRNDPIQFSWDVFGVQLWRAQRQICKAVSRSYGGPVRVAVKSGHKIGKALAVDTPIPTPSGWTTMGDIAVGDQVFDERGHPCSVIAATDVMLGHTCYDVVFSDGTVVVADADHQWLTWSAAARRSHDRAATPRHHPSVVTTEHIRSSISSNGRGRNHAIRNCEPVQYPATDVPLDPYTLGVWLGDGDSGAPMITSADPEIVEELCRAGVSVREIVGNGGAAKRYSIREVNGQKTRLVLRHIGVLKNKHVPAVYLRGSVTQRLALLQGLMDTDGSAKPNGGVEFCNTNKRIADSVYELAASLGMKPVLSTGRAMLRGKDCGEKYRVTFTPHSPVFRLSRKLARQHGGKTKATWAKQRMIVDVRPRESVPVRCIQVDSPSSLFLCSRAFIPTHNSTLIAIIALWWWVTRSNARVIMTAPTARQIRSILWREVTRLWGIASERLKAIGGIGGHLHKLPELGLQHVDNGEQSEIIGFSTTQPERMAGLSGENILFLIDEASGVEASIFEAVDGNRAGGASCIMFSNPTQTSGEFYNAFNGKKGLYTTFSFSSEETPNVKCGRKVIPGLATRQWIEEKREEWGPDYLNDPRYRVRVLGEFPLNASDQVISPADTDRAKANWFLFAANVLGRVKLLEDSANWSKIIRTPSELALVRGAWMNTTDPLQIGVDPAHYGDDLTVIYARRGLRAFRPVVRKHGDGQEVADAVLELVRSMRHGVHEVPPVLLDVIGVGVSAYDHLKLSNEIKLKPVNSGKAPTDGNVDEYVNLRAEIGFNVRKWIRRGGGFEPEQCLEDDLLAPRYSLDGVGRVQIESKKDLKKRLGHSPDYGDGFGLAVFDGALKTRTVYLPKMNQPLRFGEQTGRGFG